MMDTVINNMAQIIPNGTYPPDELDYSVFQPFNNKDYFHPYCKIKDWNNFTDAQDCQTGDLNVPLPDLYTEHETVRSLLIDWAKKAIKTYSIDGLRIDAAKHVDSGFLKEFTESIGVFSTGEVLEGAVSIISNYQNKYIGSMPNYPIYFQMLQAFTMGNTSVLALEVEAMKQACPDVNALVSFSENHDKPRIGSMSNDTAVCSPTLRLQVIFTN
jgi:alpha-amylase